ncbi:MAG: fibrillarin-like rRNA/tRNA 2'-O-methyltransferase [Candidatus Nanohaloarchaea archaeon]
MEEIQPGVFSREGLIYTRNADPGRSVYGENLVEFEGVEYRRWIGKRSKVGAAIQKGMETGLEPDMNVLYLGAASGTTVSHFSDILTSGIIVGVEYSDTVIKNLVKLAERRKNIAPVLGNARNPGEYSSYLEKYDYVFQDISQKDQASIFLKNCDFYLKNGGTGLLSVKARSISDSRPEEEIFGDVKDKVSESYSIVDETRLEPYEEDHLVLKVER